MSAYAEWLARVGKRKAALAVCAVVLAGGAVGWPALQAGVSTPPLPVVDGAPAASADALVFVSGAVAHPGLYQLSSDARVADAIAAAGGLTLQADAGRLPDLAARVHDGRQVNVPFARSGTSSTARLDINSATADELDAVPGMPPGLGEAIVEQRDLWGPFASLSELRTDLGVDAATVAALGHYLRVFFVSP